MLNYIIFIIVTTSLAHAQRPSYAGTSLKGYPGLASRFQDVDAPTATENVALGNRIGNDEGSNIVIPVDARGDVDLVNRLNSWPRENRPFWLINAEQIEKNRRPNNIQEALANRNRQGTNLASRSSFGNSGGRDSIPVKPELPRSSFLGPAN